MHPILAHFGEITVHTYGFVMMAALFFIYFLARAHRDETLLEPSHLGDISFLVVFSIWFGGGLILLLLSGEYSLANLRAHLNPARLESLSTVAVTTAFFLLLAGYCHWKKLPFWRVMDFLIPYFVLGYGLQRTFGCFSAGCCHGTPTTLPWGVTFGETFGIGPPAGIPVHPTQLYMGLAALASSRWLLTIQPRSKEMPGALTGLGTVALFGVYFMVSFWRGDLKGERLAAGLTSNQWFALLLILLGAMLWSVAVWRDRRQKRGRD
ncbi:Phosphatidylglycerol--prolipoprotein diacylglyceryl transferase [Candidatus Magnetaquicoccaceae bacterium FCR-1]|uniref:Phosphatidylglycerol--prolipoprotein diacylglyceryl transferase n=1 Tax=Candidatus Magnetaquiglobus chichijimensis TaxID=3141448 RepID=A0ABQ0CCB2_9PROT